MTWFLKMLHPGRREPEIPGPTSRFIVPIKRGEPKHINTWARWNEPLGEKYEPTRDPSLSTESRGLLNIFSESLKANFINPIREALLRPTLFWSEPGPPEPYGVEVEFDWPRQDERAVMGRAVAVVSRP